MLKNLRILSLAVSQAIYPSSIQLKTGRIQSFSSNSTLSWGETWETCSPTWWDTLQTLQMSLNLKLNHHQPGRGSAETPFSSSTFRTWVSKTLPTHQMWLSLAPTCAPLPTLRTMRPMTRQPSRNTWATSRSSRCWANRSQKARAFIKDRTVRNKPWVSPSKISRC